MLRILVETRCLYRRLFGKHVIERVELNVHKSAGLSHRLWTNGADRIYLTLSRKRQLEPPAKSGVRNLHGLTHEMAHLVLYRSLINLPMLESGWGEGWAVYVASFLAIPHLYAKHGPVLWPYPHDFLKTDGAAMYALRFHNKRESSFSPELSIVWRLHCLERALGRREFVQLLRRQLRAPVRADRFVSEMNEAFRTNNIAPTKP
jgi:hypothetical protein